MGNEKIYCIIECDGIWLQVVNHSKVKKKNKYLQFVINLHLFSFRRPMINFESVHHLFQFLKVDNTSNKH